MAFDHLATHGLTLESMQSHGLIVGPTGCGKTTRVIAPLVCQLMRHMSPARNEARHRASIVIIDLKGDAALFEGCRREAEQARLVFRWFTPSTGQASYAWNPLRQSFLKRLRNEEIVQLILAGLSLDFGEDYGRSWFMNNILRALREALKQNRVTSFRSLARMMREQPALVGGRDVVKSAEHLVEVMEQLAEHPVLNAAEGEPAFDANGDKRRHEGQYGAGVLNWQIDISQLLRVPQVTYFWLPVKTVGVGSRMIGRLFIHELMAATETLVRNADEQNRIYLWVDEFHELVDRGERLARLFSQARSNRVSCLVAHQSAGQTRTLSGNLEEISRESVAFHLRMGMPSMKDLPQVELEAGDEWRRTSVSRSENGVSESWSERPKITRNRLLQMAATPGEAWLRVRDSSENGWGHPYGMGSIIELSHHVSATEYRSRANSIWPSSEDYPGTFVALPENPHYWGEAPLQVEGTHKQSTLPAPTPTPTKADNSTSDYVREFFKRAATFLTRHKQSQNSTDPSNLDS